MAKVMPCGSPRTGLTPQQRERYIDMALDHDVPLHSWAVFHNNALITFTADQIQAFEAYFEYAVTACVLETDRLHIVQVEPVLD